MLVVRFLQSRYICNWGIYLCEEFFYLKRVAVESAYVCSTDCRVQRTN